MPNAPKDISIAPTLTIEQLKSALQDRFSSALHIAQKLRHIS
jgi:hypothetical protein